MNGKILFVGIGNAFRQDDGAGIAMLQLARQRLGKSLHWNFLQASGEGAGLMHAWQNYPKVIVFDAVMNRGTPGKIYYLLASEENLPTDFFKYSTHAFSLAEAVEMARALDRLPPELHIYGVEGESFGYGEQLSPQVEKGCQSAVQQMVETIFRQMEAQSNYA